MKILHTIPSMGVNSGGPALSTFLTVSGLQDKGIATDILTYQVSDPLDRLIASKSYIHTLPPVHNSFAYSGQYKDFLIHNKQYNLYHIQGVWQYPSYITPKIARTSNKPYIITPRGMLYPQDIARGKWKKTLFLNLFLLHDLQRAACVHATCTQEMEHLRNLGVTSPIAVIPNPVDTANLAKEIIPHIQLRIGYLGRLHPRKNIERLLYAWAQLQPHAAQGELLIIGNGDRAYLRFLQQEAVRLKLKNVVFTGFLSGAKKTQTIASLSYLCVPSDFENFGMIIPEALLQGVPVIASKGTPWEELQTHDCGWWVDNNVQSITQTLAQAINIPENERIAMGRRGQTLILNNYSTDIVAKKISQLYHWILTDNRTKPDFICLHK